MNFNPETIEKLRDRYRHIHPLIFHRSCERANSEVDLFDILEGMPEKKPIYWNESSHSWVHTRDLFLSENFRLD